MGWSLKPFLAMIFLIALAVIPGCATVPLFGVHLSNRQCLIRAMYFESNRSSAEGLLAVGTVVMNRVRRPDYPNSICAVVGQRNQFAPGVLSKRMRPRSEVLAASVADKVLAGARHPALRNTEHFHQAGLRFPYTNMHYVLRAGGNDFYEKW